MKQALGFVAVMAVVFYVAPIAFPTYSPTVVQAAAVTLLAFVGRAVLAEGINVKVDDMKMVMYSESSEEEDE